MNKMNEEQRKLLRLEQRLKKARIEDIGLELLGGIVKKRPISPDYRGLCPFHVDTHPSFFLKVKWNKYICFGCSVAGGPLDLPFQWFNRDDKVGLSYLENKFSFSRNNSQEMAVVKMAVLQMLKKSEGKMYPFKGIGWNILEEFEPFYENGQGSLIQVYNLVMEHK